MEAAGTVPGIGVAKRDVPIAAVESDLRSGGSEDILVTAWAPFTIASGPEANETNSPASACMQGSARNDAKKRNRKDPKTSFAAVRIPKAWCGAPLMLNKYT